MPRQWKALTKQDLLDWGIVDVKKENGEWVIYREWFFGGMVPRKVLRTVKVSSTTLHHKYGRDKTYHIVVFSVNRRPMTIPLQRLLYAWFIGDIPDKMVVDHIDNNPLNNELDNLQLLTVSDNLAKRKLDNPDNCCNQHEAKKKYGKQMGKADLLEILNLMEDKTYSLAIEIQMMKRNESKDQDLDALLFDLYKDIKDLKGYIEENIK